MTRIGAAVLLGTVYVMVGMGAMAHHSTAMFDDKKTIELTGIVKEFQWANPHTWLIITVTNPDGTETSWGFEASAGPTVLLRVGMHKGDFTPGTRVKLTGHPVRDGRPAAQWLTATRLSDGKVFDVTRGLD